MASTAAPLSPKTSIPEWKETKVQELQEVLPGKSVEILSVKSSVIEQLENPAKLNLIKADETKPIIIGTSSPSEEIQENNENKVFQKIPAGQTLLKPSEEMVSGDILQNPPVAEHFVVNDSIGASKDINEKSIPILADVHSSQNIIGVQDGAAPLSDLEKKQRRAERFGVDVKMSEYEKRKLRAARFGVAANNLGKGNELIDLNSSKMNPTSKELEVEKRKARATRFSTSESSGKHCCGEDAKKRARLARFGSFPDARTNLSSEEDKKERADRFGSAAKEEGINGESNI